MWLGGEPQYIDGRAKQCVRLASPPWSGVTSLYRQQRQTELVGPRTRSGLSAAATAATAAAAAAAPITGVRKYQTLPQGNLFKLHSYCMSTTIVLHGYLQYISCFLTMVQYFVILFKLVHFCARISSVLLGIQKT